MPLARHALPVLAPVAGFVALLGIGYAFPAIQHVVDLSLPFFGLIGLGFICGRIMRLPEAGLVWMNFFIVYVSLPALFINMISVTPFAQLGNWPFVLTTTAVTALGYGLAFVAARLIGGVSPKEATLAAVAGSYANVGYMGPGLTLAALGPTSTVPTALIFVFDSMFFFSVVPFLVSLTGGEKTDFGATARLVVKRVATHPFNVATAVGVAMAYFQASPPAPVAKLLTLLQNAAAPSALFVMGVTIALREVKRTGREMPALLTIKLVTQPLIVWAALSLVGDFGRVWTFTAVLMAALPPALNAFVMANQYQTYVERASATILIGTLCSVVTVTGLLYLIASGLVPYRLFH
jgi:hypothetical protein